MIQCLCPPDFDSEAQLPTTQDAFSSAAFSSPFEACSVPPAEQIYMSGSSIRYIPSQCLPSSTAKGNDQRDQSWNIADHEEGFRFSKELSNANRR